MQVQNTTTNFITRAYTRQADAVPGDAARTGGARATDGRPRTDSLAISTNTREVQRMRDAAADAPDVRAERVAMLKAMVRNGSYHVDTHTLAAHLLSR